MKYLLGSREMKALDAYTITQMQLPSAVLMERAALAVAGSGETIYGQAKPGAGGLIDIRIAAETDSPSQGCCFWKG